MIDGALLQNQGVQDVSSKHGNDVLFTVESNTGMAYTSVASAV